jgi:hypothetical protein
MQSGERIPRDPNQETEMLTYTHRPTGLQCRVMTVNRGTGMATIRTTAGESSTHVLAVVPCSDLQADQFDLIPQPQQLSLEAGND